MPQIKTPTDEQQLIIDDTGNIVVTAKPGSGKTFTIVEKINQVSQGLHDHQGVIAISFTRKASRELEQRAIHRGIPKRLSFYGTIDSFYISQIITPFAKHLTKAAVQLDVKTALKDCPEYMALAEIKRAMTPDLEQLLITSLVDGHIFLDLCGETALYILENVKEASDYLISRYSHIFIDEYQDCGNIQHRIFTFLVERGMTGVAVGDIDQAIYAFTNRYPKYLVSLLAHPKFTSYEITKNHRCHKSISDYSLRLLGKDISPASEKRVLKVSINGDEESIAEKIGAVLEQIKTTYNVDFNNQIAILCRNNATADRVASGLGLPYKLFKDTDLDKLNSYWARFFNDFLQSYFDPEVFNVDFTARYFNGEIDNLSYQKALRIIDMLFSLNAAELHKHLSQIVSLAKMVYPENEKADAVDILKQILLDDDKLQTYAPARQNEVNILSLHKSKGLEYDIVFHMDLYEYVMPPYKGTQEDYEQALNLHYVGITRAKKVCYIMQGTIRHNSSGAPNMAKESSFLHLNGLANYRRDVTWNNI